MKNTKFTRGNTISRHTLKICSSNVSISKNPIENQRYKGFYMKSSKLI